MKPKFLLCRHCGNLAALLRDRGVPLFCCGEAMEELRPGTSGASSEKHTPVYTVEGDSVRVTVGAAEHPMTEEHRIEWIALETRQGIQFAPLSPGGRPEARFPLAKDDAVQAVYAFCDQHELWRN